MAYWMTRRSTEDKVGQSRQEIDEEEPSSSRKDTEGGRGRPVKVEQGERETWKAGEERRKGSGREEGKPCIRQVDEYSGPSDVANLQHSESDICEHILVFTLSSDILRYASHPLPGDIISQLKHVSYV